MKNSISKKFQSLSPKAQRRIEKQQAVVDRLLTRGIIFSVIWILGFGSFISVFLAVKAHRVIRKSDGLVFGMDKVWWCYLIGGGGILFFTMFIVAAMINR